MLIRIKSIGDFMKNRILVSTILLGTFGVLMVFSASFVWAEYKMGSAYYYGIRQAIFFVLGVALMLFIAKIDYHIYEKYAKWFFIIGISLLILVLIPFIGSVRGGARSWIGIGSFSIQPSEFMKLSMMIFLSSFLANYGYLMKKLKIFLLIVSTIILSFGLIMLEPDFGSGMILTLGSFLLLYIAGIKPKWFIFILLCGITGAILLVIIAPYRLERIMSYINPWNDPLGSGFQSIQSLYALSPGGLFGLGLFKSRQKFFYLPEPQTDFIFAIITEELGFLGSFMIFLVFLSFFYAGYLTSIKAKDLLGFYLAAGITGIIFIQFFMNISVVIGLIPITGVTLPFISYGGSSLIVNYLMVGILLNISNNA